MAFGKDIPLSDTFNAQDFVKRINLYDKKQRAAAKAALLENAFHLEHAASEMAPILEGHLTDSIKAKPTIAEKPGPTLEAEVHAGTESLSAPYALRMHESMWPAIPVSDTRFMPSAKSAGRAGDAAGPAGGKYLTRPLIFYMRTYTKNIADMIGAVR